MGATRITLGGALQILHLSPATVSNICSFYKYLLPCLQRHANRNVYRNVYGNTTCCTNRNASGATLHRTMMDSYPRNDAFIKLHWKTPAKAAGPTQSPFKEESPAHCKSASPSSLQNASPSRTTFRAIYHNRRYLGLLLVVCGGITLVALSSRCTANGSTPSGSVRSTGGEAPAEGLQLGGERFATESFFDEIHDGSSVGNAVFNPFTRPTHTGTATAPDVDDPFSHLPPDVTARSVLVVGAG